LPRRQKVRAAAVERELDFAELPSYVGYQVRRAQAAIFGEFETMLADFDLTPGSFGVLTLIKANPGITQVALAAAFGVDKSTMSPVIIRLEVLLSDRRCHALFFEPTAAAYYAAARDKVRVFEEGLAARLSKAEQREFARLLGKLQGNSGG
jgi:DNA-binding MarR family transcriptional regulator